MKLIINRKTKYYDVVVQTPEGKRTIATPYKSIHHARTWAQQSNCELAEGLSKAGALTREVMQQLQSGFSSTCEEALEKWCSELLHVTQIQPITVRTYSRKILGFLAFNKLEGKKLTVIQPIQCKAWIQDNPQPTLALRELRLNILRQFMRWCFNKGFINANPMAAIRRVNGRLLPLHLKERKERRPFTPEEFDRLCATIEEYITSDQHCLSGGAYDHWQRNIAVTLSRAKERLQYHEFFRVAVVLSRYTGARLKDCAYLERDAIARPGYLLLWTSKRDKRIQIEIPKVVQDALAMVRPLDPHTPVFNIGNRKSSLFCFPWAAAIYESNESHLPAIFHRIIKRSGIVGKSFHDLRATCITEVAQSLGVEQARKLVGHTSPQMTERYIPAAVRAEISSDRGRGWGRFRTDPLLDEVPSHLPRSSVAALLDGKRYEHGLGVRKALPEVSGSPAADAP